VEWIAAGRRSRIQAHRHEVEAGQRMVVRRRFMPSRVPDGTPRLAIPRKADRSSFALLLIAE